MKISKHKYQILFALFIISLIASLILSLTPASEICDPDKGCDVVHHSSYNYIFGIQNSYFGAVIFALGVFLIYFQIKKPTKQKRNLINVIIILGSLIALYFLFLQLFILDSICSYVLFVYLIIIISLFLLHLNLKK